LNHNKLSIKIKSKQYRPPSIPRLLDCESDSDISLLVKEFWKEFNGRLEEDRFSGVSHAFFQYLKNAFKYNQIDKKDGGIINSLLDDCGSLITEKNIIAQELMKTLAEFQVNPNIPQTDPLEFPNLSYNETGNITNLLSLLKAGKATSWDGVSDVIFKASNRQLSEKIFADLWTNLQNMDSNHFLCRLVPLNKKFPHIPTRRDMRPIVIQSPLLKLTESVLLPELQHYLKTNLHPSQTGFVPDCGILVNIHRALDQILNFTRKGKKCYGLFIDFTSAYNTLDHNKLFSRINPIIGENKTRFLQAIYSHIQIQYEGERIHPNQGVAQGSLAKPIRHLFGRSSL